MTRSRRSAQRAAHRTRTLLGVGLIALVAAVVAPFGYRSMQAPGDSAAPTATTVPAAGKTPEPTATESPRRAHGGPVGEADGVVPDGTTVFDDAIPAVAELDTDLLTALREAATDAAAYGVEFQVNSGWRSPAYQERLLREAVGKYGSAEEAARWVATPRTSPHVSGDAVDIGKADAQTWLVEHGAAYGLCPVYRNEPWHYELRTEAIGSHCPVLYADPTHDPRMQS
ncbi:M15 family metallopeptidase [Streptomyces sp. WMMC500]|uniref:M15 family metallopeptidase n=1 Tax=Streptomyces sp. WMMC500 TaxID=3015154 RepID=UPI00248A9136|nr:M15 family metallopeptidase [Streptomyces sp. WMMC500]WBB59952.1 M15 family metallopeptidase [Streptomyces sp. WMMC500]